MKKPQMILLTSMIGLDLSAQVFVTQDKFEGTKNYFTKPFAILQPSVSDAILGGLEEYQGQKASKAATVAIAFSTPDPVKGPYFIQVGLGNNDWIFISEGESLKFKADGTMISLCGKGSRNNREVEVGGISETAIYPITLEQLNTLAKAKELMVRIYGDKGEKTIIWGQKARKPITDFTEFVNNKVNPPAKTIYTESHEDREKMIAKLNKQWADNQDKWIWSFENENMVLTCPFSLMAGARTENMKKAWLKNCMSEVKDWACAFTAVILKNEKGKEVNKLDLVPYKEKTKQ